MGKLNKKLLQAKPILKTDKTEHDSKADSAGPFPIYRTIPVQLNGPEPKTFKVSAKKSKFKHGNKPVPASVPESPKPTNDEPDTPAKVKKLRKTTITRLTKKEKIKFRKEEILKKIELTQNAFKEEKLKKKREKTVVTGDMRPLLDALPSLESLFKMKSAETIKTGVPKYDKKAVPKTKQQLKVERLKKKKVDFLARCQKVNQVLKSTKFKKNPKKMVAEHIRNTRKEQLQLLMGNS